jgi:hypothetical protein
MSFLGKILIVAQVVLSLLFMCAAGAVFTSHVGWRDEFNKKDADYKNLQATHATEITNLNQKLDGLTESERNQKDRADAQVGRVQQLEQENGALKQDKNALNQQLQTSTGLAEAKSSEAEFRQAEAERMRVQFETVSGSLDEQIRKTVALEDELGTQKAAYDELTAQPPRCSPKWISCRRWSGKTICRPTGRPWRCCPNRRRRSKVWFGKSAKIRRTARSGSI